MKKKNKNKNKNKTICQKIWCENKIIKKRNGAKRKEDEK